MPEEIMAITIVTILSATGLGFALIRSVSKHFERKSLVGEPDESLRLDLEDLRTHVGDLEDRLEFAERLLAKGRDEAGHIGR